MCFFQVCTCLRFQQGTIHLCPPHLTHYHQNLTLLSFHLFPALYQAYYIISPTVIMSSINTIFTSIFKPHGQNWHAWSKETDAYLTMEDFWVLADPTEAVPVSVANIQLNKKAYAHSIWFLVEPNCWDLIVKLKSEHEAWAILQAKHKKDTL